MLALDTRELTCLNLYTYYLAAMLTHAHNCLITDDTNTSVVLEAAHSGSYAVLYNFLYRRLRASYRSDNPGNEGSDQSLVSYNSKTQSYKWSLVPSYATLV